MAPLPAPPRSPRAVGVEFGLLPAAVLLLPGLLLVGPWAPLRETAVRAALLFLWLAVVLQRRGARLPRSAAALAALGLLAGLGLWLHPARIPDAVGGSLVLLAVPAGIAAAACRPVGETEARRAFAWIGAAGVAAAAWVLVDRAAGRPPVGPFGRAGVTGPTLAALLPFTASATARWLAGRPRAARAVPSAVVGAALVLSGSRTGAFAGAFAAAWMLRGALPAARARALGVATAAGLVLGALVVVLAARGAIDGSFLGRTDTLAVRRGLASAAWTLATERPLLGHGAESFRSEVLRVRDPEEARTSGDRRPLAAHDDYLHVAAEGGLLAGAGLVALVAGALFVAGRGRRRGESAEARAVRTACFAAIGAIGLAALAEDPFLEAPTVLLFGVAAGTAAALRGSPAGAPRAAGAVVAAVAGVALLAAAGAHALRGVADAWVARGRPESALAAWPRHPDALYLHAVALARERSAESAREAYRRLLAIDPGRTEARLDVASLYRLEGRAEDERSALEEARRRDPTRYETALRIGHRMLGDEPPPSKRAPPADPVAILRAYNEAASLEGPLGRFETPVAVARVHRRLGDLPRAAQTLRGAVEVARRRGPGTPGELLLESFRLAEAEKAHAQDAWGILVLALGVDPRLAGEVAREAERFLDAGEEAEAAAKARVPETMKLDFSAANADFEAAALRFAGLFVAEPARAAEARRTARGLAAGGRHRRALAIYRALLADPFAKATPELAFEAARSAARVDPGLQTSYSARGRTLLGYEALERGDLAAARRDFEAAVDKAPDGAAGLYGLAKVYARMGESNAAREALKRAALHDPRALEHAASDPDLAPLR